MTLVLGVAWAFFSLSLRNVPPLPILPSEQSSAFQDPPSWFLCPSLPWHHITLHWVTSHKWKITWLILSFMWRAETMPAFGPPLWPQPQHSTKQVVDLNNHMLKGGRNQVSGRDFIRHCTPKTWLWSLTHNRCSLSVLNECMHVRMCSDSTRPRSSSNTYMLINNFRISLTGLGNNIKAECIQVYF